MGCDIHFVIEELIGGRWEAAAYSDARDFDVSTGWPWRVFWPDGMSRIYTIPVEIVDRLAARHYGRFGVLAGVRRDPTHPPIAQGRGIPTACSGTTRRAWRYWDVDGHTPGWCTFDEIARHPDSDEEFKQLAETLSSGPTARRLVFWFDN